MFQVRAACLDDTAAIAAVVADLARAGDIIILAGEMGAGKTAFAQRFGASLGVTEPITSPTYTLVHSYDCGRITLHHADLYRLDRMSEVGVNDQARLIELSASGPAWASRWGRLTSALEPYSC